jgi:hypothetical protein
MEASIITRINRTEQTRIMKRFYIQSANITNYAYKTYKPICFAACLGAYIDNDGWLYIEVPRLCVAKMFSAATVELIYAGRLYPVWPIPMSNETWKDISNAEKARNH